SAGDRSSNSEGRLYMPSSCTRSDPGSFPSPTTLRIEVERRTRRSSKHAVGSSGDQVRDGRPVRVKISTPWDLTLKPGDVAPSSQNASAVSVFHQNRIDKRVPPEVVPSSSDFGL